MERKELANDIVDFALEYGVFNISGQICDIKRRIEEQFIDFEFVEGLINMIIVKTKDKNDIDTGRLIELLIELEKIRLELEYKDSNNS